jgi:PKD repeat protein
MIVKESADDPAHVDSTGLVKLVILRSNGTWESYTHSTVGDDMTRPIILLEPSKGQLHVFATSPVAGGVVYKKTTSMANPSFGSGKGTPFIKLASQDFVNNATSTKQNITAESGILVLASDQKDGMYVHNYVPGVVPTANFSATPTAGREPLPVQFTDLSTKAPTSWSWNFGDGSPVSTTRNPAHTYTKAGTYTVSLTATNVVGSSTAKTMQVVVQPALPVANFTYTPSAGPAPLAVKFTNTSTGSSKWSWDFGDGTPVSTEQSPSHTFTKQGIYKVTLTAFNADNETATKTVDVQVSVSVPKADFTWSPTTGTAPLAVKFTDTSTGPPASWAWTFGDGGTSTQQSPSYTYAKPGTYTVSLKVTNASGTSTKTASVVVASVAPVVVLDKPAAAVTLSSYVDVAWHATTDPAAVKGYDVEVSSIAAGRRSTWSTSVMANQTGAALRMPAQAGYTYCMRVRGTNTSAVVGAWSAPSCTTMPLDDRSLARKGDWRRASASKYYMGTASITRERGATLSKTVTGKQVYLLVNQRSGGGKVKVYEGNRLVKKVSLAARASRKGQQLITIASHAEDTTARYRIVVTTSGKPVIIDGLAVTR